MPRVRLYFFARVDRTRIVLRTPQLRLSTRERMHADHVLRRLWPGLVGVPHRRRNIREDWGSL